MRTINNKTIKSYVIGAAIATSITLAGAVFSEINMSGSASVSYDEGDFDNTYRASLNTAAGHTNDGCMFYYRNVDLNDEDTLAQTKTGSIKIKVDDPGKTRISVAKIIKQYSAHISREQTTKSSYSLIIHPQVDKFKDVISALTKEVSNTRDLEKVTCSENVTNQLNSALKILKTKQAIAKRIETIYDQALLDFDEDSTNVQKAETRRIHVALSKESKINAGAIIDLQSLEREVYRLRSNGSNKNAKLNAIKTAEANYLQAEAEVLSLEREVAHLINSTKYATIAITIQQLPSDL